MVFVIFFSGTEGIREGKDRGSTAQIRNEQSKGEREGGEEKGKIVHNPKHCQARGWKL